MKDETGLDFEMMEPPTPLKDIRADTLARADRAWRARVLGATWAQCAELAGFSDESGARRAVKRVYGEVPQVEREELRRLWRDRLEVVARQAMQDVLDRRPGAVTSYVRLMQAAARLDGLDEPSRLELSTPSEREIVAWVDAMVAHNRPQLVEADIFADPLDAEVIEASDP